MPNSINPDQVGLIHGRQAPDVARNIINLLHYAQSSKKPTVFLVLDTEKAFDRIHWGYLNLASKAIYYRQSLPHAFGAGSITWHTFW